MELIEIALVLFVGCSYLIYKKNDTGLSWAEVFKIPNRKKNKKDLY